MPAINVYVTEEEYLALIDIGKKENKKATEVLQDAVKEFLTKEVKNP
jgi:hypothetical protein